MKGITRMKISWVGRIGIGLIVLALVIAGGAFFLGYFRTPEAEARTNLKLALDSWVAQTPAATFQDAHPEIAFSDTDLLDKRLVRYDVTSPATKEDAFLVFPVRLTLLKDGKEIEFPRTYKVGRVKTPQGKEVWAIIGHTK
jgi:hypothetical protein